MILFIIISFLLLVLLWILFAPIIIRVDTGSEDYSVRLPGILKASVFRDEYEIYMKIRILFIPVKIRPSGLAGWKPDGKIHLQTRY